MACLVAQSLVLARGKDSRMASDCVKCKASKTSASDPKRGKSISSSFGALISIHFDNEIKTSNIQIVHSVQVRSIFDSFSATTYNTIFHAAALEWTLDFSLFLIFFWKGLLQLLWHCSVVCLGSLSSRRNFIKFILLPVYG